MVCCCSGEPVEISADSGADLDLVDEGNDLGDEGNDVGAHVGEMG